MSERNKHPAFSIDTFVKSKFVVTKKMKIFKIVINVEL